MLEGLRIVTFSTPLAKQTRLERAGFDVRAQSKRKNGNRVRRMLVKKERWDLVLYSSLILVLPIFENNKLMCHVLLTFELCSFYTNFLAGFFLIFIICFFIRFLILNYLGI